MPAPVERRRKHSEPRWASETPSGERVPATARDAERMVELRSAEPAFRAGVESLAEVLQKPNRVLDPEVTAEALPAEVAWTAAEAIRRVQALNFEMRRLHRLNNRGAVDGGHVRDLGVTLKEAERVASAFLGQPVTGEALWQRGGPEQVEEREASLDRYGPRRHEMTAASRSRDA